jgi:acetyltransferase-like isoleucine patch superfamily enzyme
MRSILLKIKRKLFTKTAVNRALSVGKKCRVNAYTKFTSKTIIGDNCNFNGMKVLGKGKVTIGNNFHSGQECMIISSYHNYDNGAKIPYDETTIDKDVQIDDNVWIGHRVIILGGVEIGEGAIIQAGSVVVNNIPRCAIAGGSPAKVFKYRNIEHYEKLKREGKFF